MANSAINPALLIPTSGITNAMLATGVSAAKITADNLPVAQLPTGGAWSLSSDLNIDSNTFVVDQANNRVGIGTAAPSSKLTIQAAASTAENTISLRHYNPAVGGDMSIAFTDADGDFVLGSIGNDYNVTKSAAWTSNVYGYSGFAIRTGPTPATALFVDGTQKVGIGTKTPASMLQVSGAPTAILDSKTIIIATNNTTAYNASPASAITMSSVYDDTGATTELGYISAGKENAINGDFSGYLSLGTRQYSGSSTMERMRITSGGKVGIGTTSLGASKFRIKGDGGGASSTTYPLYIINADDTNIFYVRDDGAVAIPQTGNGSLSISSGIIVSSSDARLKNDKPDAKIYGLSEVLKLKPHRFNWKDSGKEDFGFFAQEVGEIIPEALGQPAKEGGMYGLYDRPIIATLVKAIQEQQKQIDELKQKVA